MLQTFQQMIAVKKKQNIFLVIVHMISDLMYLLYKKWKDLFKILEFISGFV
jgi:hypothetical protein